MKQNKASGAGRSRSRTSGGTKKANAKRTQRTDLRRLREEQARKEREQGVRRRGLPMWGRTLIAVAVIFLLMLVLFRVNTVEVSGNVRYTVQDVTGASGITEGDVLMGVGKSKVASRILVKLPYVEQVTVSKLLPGTVRLTIQECQAMAAAESEAGKTWLLNARGKLLEELDEDTETAYPLLVGTELELPIAGDPAGFRDSDRGDLAMELARAVQDAGMQDRIRQIDVTRTDQVTLDYAGRIEVQVGDGSDMAYKLQYLAQAAGELGADARGVLDLSFAAGTQAVFHPLS